MLTYTLEYQDHGFEYWKHKVLSYEMLMTYPHNLLRPTQPVNIGYHPYLHRYQDTYLGSYRLYLQHRHLPLSRNPKPRVILLWRISDAFGTPHIDIPSQSFSTWRCNILICITVWTHIVHWDRDLLAISTITAVLWLINECMVPISYRLSDWWHISPAWNPLPYN